MHDGVAVNSVPVTGDDFVVMTVSDWLAVLRPPVACCRSSVAPVSSVVLHDIPNDVLPSLVSVAISGTVSSGNATVILAGIERQCRVLSAADLLPRASEQSPGAAILQSVRQFSASPWQCPVVPGVRWSV
jgi:hypothetical protein